jgi:hypothetical protein
VRFWIQDDSAKKGFKSIVRMDGTFIKERIFQDMGRGRSQFLPEIVF